MPIPTPKKDESKVQFINRCMSDDVMKKEFSDTRQRAAVCHQKWRDKKK